MATKIVANLQNITEGSMGVKLRKRKRESGRTYLYLDIYQHGNRSTELIAILTGDKFQDSETKRMAEEIRNKRERELLADRHGIMDTHRRKENFIRYCEELAEQRPAENTRISWRQAIGHLKEVGGEGVSFADLNRQFFEKFRDYLLKEVKLSPNSAQVYLARIKTAIHQAVDDGILLSDPSAKVTIRKSDKLPVHLTIEEVRKLSKTPCANDQVKAAFLFSCFTGLRYSDVDQLTWDKIKDSNIEFNQKKTGAAERLPLAEEAKRILNRQKRAKPNANLRRDFPKNTIFFLPTQPVVDKQLKRWAKDAKIHKTISFHKSRHTFATLSLSSGVDLYTVSKLLGHRNLAATQIYAKVVDEKKKQAIEMLPTL